MCGEPAPYKGSLTRWGKDEERMEMYDCYLCKEHRYRSHLQAKRVHCERQGCGKPLKGRQQRWCSRICWALGNRKANYLWRILHDRQEGLCGICVLPLDVPRGFMSYRQYREGLVYTSPFNTKTLETLVEVDHVVPVAKGGDYDMSNLRAAHRKCNQGKKSKDLAFYRWQIGILEDVVESRLQGVSEEACALLSDPRVSAEGYVARPAGTSRPVMEGQSSLL